MNNYCQVMNCPKCGEPVTYYGSTGRQLLSNPPKNEDIVVCHKCKIKKIVITSIPIHTPKEDELKDYEWV